VFAFVSKGLHGEQWTDEMKRQPAKQPRDKVRSVIFRGLMRGARLSTIAAGRHQRGGTKVAEEDGAIERRIAALEDREAIYDLVKDYCNAIDDREIDKYANLMAEHVELCQFEGGNRRIGRQAVRDWMEWRFTQWGLSRHYPLNHRITVLNESDGKGIVNGWAEMAMDHKIYVTAIGASHVARRRCTTTRRPQICRPSTPSRIASSFAAIVTRWSLVAPTYRNPCRRTKPAPSTRSQGRTRDWASRAQRRDAAAVRPMWPAGTDGWLQVTSNITSRAQPVR
jgi:hypothetical protein